MHILVISTHLMAISLYTNEEDVLWNERKYQSRGVMRGP